MATTVSGWAASNPVCGCARRTTLSITSAYTRADTTNTARTLAAAYTAVLRRRGGFAVTGIFDVVCHGQRTGREQNCGRHVDAFGKPDPWKCLGHQHIR